MFTLMHNCVNRIIIVFVLCLISSVQLLSQENPAENYFQQQVDYDLKLKVDDVSKSISATFTMNYYNNSEDTLHELYIHFYPLAYASDSSAYAREQIVEGSLRFYSSNKRINHAPLEFLQKGEILKTTTVGSEMDVLKVVLQESILPHSNQEIQGTFSYNMPEVFSRMGYQNNAY